MIDLGFGVAYDVITHCPYESESMLADKLKYLWSLPYGKMSLFPLTVFPGSSLAHRIDRDGNPAVNVALNDWYAWIASLATSTPWRRRLSKVVYTLRLFKRHPGFLYAAGYRFHHVKRWIMGKIMRKERRWMEK